MRWAVGFVVFFLVISCNYYLMPTEKVKFKMILPGSMFATCAVLIVTWAYSVYIGKIADYDIIYGSLASIAALLRRQIGRASCRERV